MRLEFDPIPTKSDNKKDGLISENSTEMDDFEVIGDNPAEFIFLVDRSGSMGGKPIKMAAEAVMIGLQSMPSGSFFNVVSFGSDFKLMFPESVEANQENIAKAIGDLETFDADMGGTEIFKPIKAVYA